MRAIVIKEHGGPEVLMIEERPKPRRLSGHVLIRVKAFGLNRAEVYFRKGLWPSPEPITGIECVGIVEEAPETSFLPGQKVAALVGGMGRSIPGSYAEYTSVPATNVIAFESGLPWEDLAAFPESYGTAWSVLTGILQVQKGQTLVVRGAGSALGQAALNIAVHGGVRTIATVRSERHSERLRGIGAYEVLLEADELSKQVRSLNAHGVDAVLDLVGNTTILDSLAMLRRGGQACLAGFLGGGDPLSVEPVFQIPSGRSLSVFASALVLGSKEFPISEIPLQTIIDLAASGQYQAKPDAVFRFAEIQKAHRYLESGSMTGKGVVLV
jgi:NADPH:quinone reductase